MSSCCLAIEGSGPQKGKGIKLDCMDVIKHKSSMGTGRENSMKTGSSLPSKI